MPREGLPMEVLLDDKQCFTYNFTGDVMLPRLVIFQGRSSMSRSLSLGNRWSILVNKHMHLHNTSRECAESVHLTDDFRDTAPSTQKSGCRFSTAASWHRHGGRHSWCDGVFPSPGSCSFRMLESIKCTEIYKIGEDGQTQCTSMRIKTGAAL